MLLLSHLLGLSLKCHWFRLITWFRFKCHWAAVMLGSITRLLLIDFPYYVNLTSCCL